MRSATCLLLCCLFASAAAPPVGTELPPAAKGKIDFVRDIQPLFTAHCSRCHDATKQKGGLRLDSRAHAITSGVILPGKGEKSTLVRRAAGLDGETRMPPNGPGLSHRQIAILRAWVDQGAAWPTTAPVPSPALSHWAYQPLVRPPVPQTGSANVRNVVDRFIQARLDSARLVPAPEADRRTLIRRLSFDLLGLPPTPERVKAFIADRRPNAYERLVDELLAEPGYGERQARHWLDVVHFAETHGHDQDVPRDNAWPYRDYLIRAFNADLPWSQFIEQQVAGDILTPNHPDGVVATGLLAAGPWDESSQQSIRDDTVDKKQAQNLDRDDMVTTVMSAFTSTTVHCARCHDHKFDPVSQEEYTALQAVFAGIDRANRGYDPDPTVHLSRRQLLARWQFLRTTTQSQLLDPANEAAVAAWERKQTAAVWHVPTPTALVTAHGSVPAKLPDGSIRFGGPRPERDTYTVTLQPTAALKTVTGLRLELLTDETLPHKGPGRQDNGNLHLNEFRVVAVRDGKQETLPIRSATADFNQAGWTVAMAIDGNPSTAWGIHPAVGKPHQAVFTLEKPPLALSDTTTLRVILEQTHGGGHLIGRMRLSLTSAPQPHRTAVMPANVAAVLVRDKARRTPADRATLARHVLLEQVETQIAALPAQQSVFAAANDFKPEGSFRPAAGCRPVFLLKRGEITQPTRRIGPGALSCIPAHSGKFNLADMDNEGQRRAALARWLSSPKNVLTWRSVANRLWHYHFGRGIVSTPGDLGRMGAAPSHPELLDYLACYLRDGASLKDTHRLIVTSAAYRRAVRHDAEATRADADNLLLWRMNRSRLDAESVRDAVLSVSGLLDRTIGGPSVRQFTTTKGIHVTPNVHYDAFNLNNAGANRRSVYRFVFRTLPDPFFDALDCPDASQFTPTRATSITPLQALSLLNDRFMVRQAEEVAGRVHREAGNQPNAQIRLLFDLSLSRRPTMREEDLVVRYAKRHGLAAACRMLLNSNEFHFAD